jgi:hypothetical protein
LSKLEYEDLILEREQKRNQLREIMMMRMKANEPLIRKELEAT